MPRVLGVVLAITAIAGATALPTAGAAPGAIVASVTPRIAIGLAPGLIADLVDHGERALDPAAQLDQGPRTATDAVAPAVDPPSDQDGQHSTTSAGTSERRGRNHVWSSALRLDRAIVWFPCSRSRPPDMAVYRWGCAGRNNVYLFAHAYGAFRRLHDLYVSGRLRRGMTVDYADASGATHRFAVAWWKVVLPTNGEFAFAAQARSSMTLQTCVGANSRYRLVVRLYEVD